MVFLDQEYCEDCSFDPATVFQRRYHSDGSQYFEVFSDSGTDEAELIKAAKARIKMVQKHKLSRADKSQRALQLLDETRGSSSDVTFADRLGEVLREKEGGFPSIELEYRNLTVEADALVGAAGNPTVWNSFKAALASVACRGGLETKPMKILDGMSGVIKPGRLTLLLGPPASGKSVFLQVLSGRLHTHKGLRVQGTIKYNGETMDKFVVQRTAGLVDQYDRHIPNLTVAETVKFAGDCQTSTELQVETLVAVDKAASKAKKEMEEEALASAIEEGRVAEPKSDEERANALWEAGKAAFDDGTSSSDGAGSSRTTSSEAKAKAEFIELFREAVLYRLKVYVTLHLLGLGHVADTFVGNESLRGVSGGERKRVTSAEVLVGPQNLLLMDEISTGLDSATTFSVVRSLRDVTHALKRTVVISLLQPAPEVMNLFDDLLLITDGKVIYHGPIAEAVPFFSSLGFECPPRKDLASYLQEITSPLGQITYATKELLDKHQVPEHLRDPARLLVSPPKKLLISVDDISNAFWGTPSGREMRNQLENEPFDASKSNPDFLARTHFARSGARLAILAFKRQMLLVARDRAYYIARVIQAIIMGLIISSLYASVAPPSTIDPANASEIFAQGRKAISLCVLSVIYVSMSSMPVIGFVFNTKRVFYKHRDNHFFPAWSYVVSLLFAQMPSSTAESILFSILVYWISGLYRNAATFFTFLVVVWSSSNCLAGLFRLIAFITPNMVIANATGGLLLLFLTITNGFSIIRTSIPPYLIWIYWGVNPLPYAIRSLCINELTSPPWGAAGNIILDQFGLFHEYYWIWIGVGFMWGYLILLSIIGSIALRYTNPPAPRPTLPVEVLKKEAQEELNDYVRRTYSADSVSNNNSNTTSDAQQLSPALSQAQSADIAMQEKKKDISVPFVPISLVCRNICYYVNDPSGGSAPGVVKEAEDREIAGKLRLLNNINFYACPGELVALMGGSGAGKTTLLDTISGRKTQGIIRGDILVNGRPKVQETWSRVVGYVEQMDIHSSRITVVESLQFSARLRLDEATVSDAQVAAIVQDTLDTVELDSLRDRIVGDPGGEGLSIEQRKRLSIAVELVANPSVLFMDEPTSGLDARSASIAMRAIRNVANGNRTVMVTIHQPSMEIFEAFDQLVLMQRGGRLTYFGALGVDSCELIQYLEGYPGVDPIKPGYNPATWMLEVTGGSMTTTFKAASLDFPDEYLKSELYAANLKKMEELVATGLASDHLAIVAGDASNGLYATSFRIQARELLKKYFAYYWRAPHYNFVRIMMTLGIAIVYGLTYLNQGKPIRPGSPPMSANTVQNIMGLIFSMAIFNGMFNCMTVMPIIYSERTVFYRERAAAMYAPRAIALAQGVAELPYMAVQALTMVVITYWMVGFQVVAWKFFYFLLLFFLTITMYTFLGQMLVFATPNMLLAQLIAAFLNQMWTIFNGFLVPFTQTPVGWQWMSRISPTTYILYGLAESQMGDSEVLMAPGAQASTTNTTVGEFVHNFFGYDYSFIWWCPLIVFGYALVFRTTTTLLISYVNFNER